MKRAEFYLVFSVSLQFNYSVQGLKLQTSSSNQPKAFYTALNQTSDYISDIIKLNIIYA